MGWDYSTSQAVLITVVRFYLTGIVQGTEIRLNVPREASAALVAYHDCPACLNELSER